MMSDSGVPSTDINPTTVAHIKKEHDVNFADCSPTNSDMYSPSTTVMHEVGVSNNFTSNFLLLFKQFIILISWSLEIMEHLTI